MKTRYIVALAIPSAAVLVAAVLVATSPSPDAVCDHIISLQFDEQPNSLAMLAGGNLKSGCLIRMNDRKRTEDFISWAIRSRTIMSARTTAELTELTGAPQTEAEKKLDAQRKDKAWKDKGWISCDGKPCP